MLIQENRNSPFMELLGKLTGNFIVNKQTNDAIDKQKKITDVNSIEHKTDFFKNNPNIAAISGGGGLSDDIITQFGGNQVDHYKKTRNSLQTLDNNSKAWYATNDIEERNRLHAENEQIRSTLKGLGFNLFGANGEDIDHNDFNKWIGTDFANNAYKNFQQQQVNDILKPRRGLLARILNL